jgi:hypothetical protein
MWGDRPQVLHRALSRLALVASLGSLALLSGTGSTLAQELELRTYANAPVGMNFIATGYGRSAGNVLLDPSLPIEDLDANIDILFLGYTRTLAVFGKAAKIKVALPYSRGRWTGKLEGVPGERELAGPGDSHLSFEVNLVGAPALRGAEFKGYRQKTIVGASLRLTVPTGEYDSTKLINLGSNRWTARTELGVSHALGRWVLEFAGNVWLYRDNDNFFGGNTLSQKNFYALKGHAIYNFRPGFWLGLGVGYGGGGQTFIDGVARNTVQRNWRFGGTAVYPLGPRDGLSLTLVSGVARGAGADFDILALAYQHAWGGG